MNKNIIFGSLVSIIILVGVSFTSVVGYNKLESNIGVSPLFNIRTNKAIDEDNKILTSDYVGKGDDFNLLIPDRDRKTVLIKKLIDRISMMDDKTYNKFLNLITKQLQNRNKDDNLNINDVITDIQHPRELTQGYTLCRWYLGCTFDGIIGRILEIILISFTLLFYLIIGKTFCGVCGPYPNTCTLKSKLNLL